MEGDRSIAKSFSRDLLYSIAGLVSMNAVIQFVVYPVLQAQMGAETYGIVISLISVIAIMCCSLATAANYSRMVVSTRTESVKGDYNIFLAIISAISVIVAIVAVIWVGWSSATEFIGMSALMVFTILRYYGDVSFRLSLNYKGFFFYYLTVSVGYLLGVGLIYMGSSVLDLVQWWWVALIIGEIGSFIYVVRKGSIYQKPYFSPSALFKENARSVTALSSAYLLSAIIMNADRLLLLAFVGGTAVTVFYTASLVGKMIALLTSPLNGVIIGYLAKHERGISRAFFAKFVVVLLVGGIVLSGLCLLASIILIHLLYPTIYDMVEPFFLVACLGQVFYFLSETVMVVVLKLARERYQFYLNVVYAIIFFAAAVPGVIYGGIWGIAWAILIVNLVRFILISGFGFMKAGKANDQVPTAE
jgi:O-antigen/teichoic acid export membrane protein